MYRISGSGSLSLGNKEATWWAVGLGGTPAMVAMRGWVCAVRRVDAERYAVYVVGALSKVECGTAVWLCCDDGCLFLSYVPT